MQNISDVRRHVLEGLIGETCFQNYLMLHFSDCIFNKKDKITDICKEVLILC